MVEIKSEEEAAQTELEPEDVLELGHECASDEGQA